MSYNITYAVKCAEYEEMTFLDFIEVCDAFELPVFEVAWTFNPFAEPHKSRKVKVYSNMSEYRKEMPSWSARNYDYENDRPTGYYVIDVILDGDFEISASNSSSTYEWHFQVLENCVVVHSKFWYTD